MRASHFLLALEFLLRSNRSLAPGELYKYVTFQRFFIFLLKQRILVVYLVAVNKSLLARLFLCYNRDLLGALSWRLGGRSTFKELTLALTLLFKHLSAFELVLALKLR